jgi:hypothetical protein
MTNTQHAHIYSFHASNVKFGEQLVLKFSSIQPYFKGINVGFLTAGSYVDEEEQY